MRSVFQSRLQRFLLRQVGFSVMRGAICPDVLTHLLDDQSEENRTVSDAVNRHSNGLEALLLATDKLKGIFHSLGFQNHRFLQVADINYAHNRQNWHRDCATRAFGSADWNEAEDRYSVYKFLLALKGTHSGLVVIPGSHRVSAISKVPDNKSRAFTSGYSVWQTSLALASIWFRSRCPRPMYLDYRPGDVIVFDERLLHRGASLDGVDFSNQDLNLGKLTFAFVIGADNSHSHRFYSYFRFYREELGFQPYSSRTRRVLMDAELLPNFDDVDIRDIDPSEASNFAGK